MPGRKKVCISLVGDIRKNSRTLRFASSLAEENDVVILALTDYAESFELCGFSVREFQSSQTDSLRRNLFRFWNAAGKEAMRCNADAYFSADLYSLPIAAHAARLHRAPLLYDSRELYSDIAALVHRPIVQWFWLALEKYYMRHCDIIFTVNDSIGEVLNNRYPGRRIQVIRNVPSAVNATPDREMLRAKLKIPPEKKILLSQGAIQKGRGGFLYVSALPELPDCVLVFLGDGVMIHDLLDLAKKIGVDNRVYHLPAVPFSKLHDHTAGADIGLCVIENTGKSYFNSLPNKLFEYIHAGLPVIGSAFPELSRVIEKSPTGITIIPEQTEAYVAAVRRLVDDEAFYNVCRKNCLSVRNEYCWETEVNKFQESIQGSF